MSFDIALPPDQYQPFRASSFRSTWLPACYEFFVCWKRQMISAADKSNIEFWLLSLIFLSCNNLSYSWDLYWEYFLCSWVSSHVSSVFSCWLVEPSSNKSTPMFSQMNFWKHGCASIINNSTISLIIIIANKPTVILAKWVLLWSRQNKAIWSLKQRK